MSKVLVITVGVASGLAAYFNSPEVASTLNRFLVAVPTAAATAYVANKVTNMMLRVPAVTHMLDIYYVRYL